MIFYGQCKTNIRHTADEIPSLENERKVELWSPPKDALLEGINFSPGFFSPLNTFFAQRFYFPIFARPVKYEVYFFQLSHEDPRRLCGHGLQPRLLSPRTHLQEQTADEVKIYKMPLFGVAILTFNWAFISFFICCLKKELFRTLWYNIILWRRKKS